MTERPQKNQIITLSIHNNGSSGEGVGSYYGYTVFVDGALPGEQVEVQLVECKKNYGKGRLIKVLFPSADRVIPPCPLFGQCGGCQLMHLSYSEQLRTKQQRVIDALDRIGKIPHPPVQACIASPSELAYRNKIQLPVRQSQNDSKLMLGLFARSSHDLIQVDHCLIHCPMGEEIYQSLRKVLQDSPIKGYDPISRKGELKHVLIKSAVNTKEALVILVTQSELLPQLDLIAEKILTTCQHVKGVIQNVQPDHTNVILGKKWKVLKGSGHIEEVLLGLKFKVSPASFFQVNPAQAEQLYQKALALAQLNGSETVLDAYCGVGTLALIFAQRAKHVIGVECVPEAIEDAKSNAQLNGLDNTSFICDEAERFIRSIHAIDLILLNPPRQGCDPLFLAGIQRLAPHKVIYVSCDPATLARDLGILHSYGYSIKEVQPFDMFPQTAHVETVVLCVKDS